VNFWENPDLTEEEKNRELTAACRRAFSTADGRAVLNMLLTDLCFFDQAPGNGGAALNNYAKFFIRERLGVRGTVALTNAIAVEAETAASGEGTDNG
jgi:hypothetical protein